MRLLDCTSVVNTNTPPDLWRTIAYDFRLRTNAKLAVVATSNIMRWMTYIYVHHVKPAECARVRLRSEALHWLGLHEPANVLNSAVIPSQI